MKKLVLTFFVLIVCLSVIAAEPALRYVDAQNFRIINKGWNNTSTPYQRLPLYMKDSCRANQWTQYTYSAGIGIRFATNSCHIGARYHISRDNVMNHMAPSGIKGTDLYRLDENNRWHYVNTGRPVKDSVQKITYLTASDTLMHEYLIYLPLYDGIDWMEIGVDSNAVITLPQVDNPRTGHKIVAYGSSIQQGGCASRTGMVFSNMVQRDMNIEVVNLATSGEGRMDINIARLMATIENVDCFVIDPLGNCTYQMCDTLTFDFFDAFMKGHPNTPVVMVEFAEPSKNIFAPSFTGKSSKNKLWHERFEQLRERYPNLYYLSEEGLTGRDSEGTVDGVHMTDYGFRAYADSLENVLNDILVKPIAAACTGKGNISCKKHQEKGKGMAENKKKKQKK